MDVYDLLDDAVRTNRRFPIKVDHGNCGSYDIIRSPIVNSYGAVTDIIVEYYNTNDAHLSTVTEDLRTYMALSRIHYMPMTFVEDYKPGLPTGTNKPVDNTYCYYHEPVNYGFIHDKFCCKKCNKLVDKDGRPL